MVEIQYVFVAQCDWCDKGRACAETSKLAAALGDSTPEEVAKAATKNLNAEGWRIANGKPTLCPTHNTKANRGKVFKQPEEGSVAHIMRVVRRTP